MKAGRAVMMMLVGLLVLGGDRSLQAQTAPAVVKRAYGRSVVEVGTTRGFPGGILGVTVRNARWSWASTLLDGRRGALSNSTGRLFGLIPVALDTPAGDHKLSLFFPGGRGRGGSTSLAIAVTALSRPGRTRALPPGGMVPAAAQIGLGHGRFLLAAIRTRDSQVVETEPLQPPVDRPVSFPFGGPEDFGMVMGPLKDGLMGEQHRGVDYDVPVGTPVKSPGLGVVLLARSLAFSGETIAIGHGNGLVSVLSHLTQVSVREGDVVTQGASVGTSGQTGLGALTPHLCFSVYLHSINVDPEAAMDASLWGVSK